MTQKQDKITGIHAVEEAVKNGLSFSRIFIQTGGGSEGRTQLMKMLREKKIPYTQVPKEKINNMSTGNHQGVVAFISPVEFQKIEHLVPYFFENGVVPLIAILDGVTDVRNFGAITRSAECLGIHALVIPAKKMAFLGEDAVKASAGALLRMNICRENSIMKTIEFLKNSGLKIISATEKGEQSLPEVNFSTPTAIILGSEGKGISREVLEASDLKVKIPMAGEISSLNVSVAASLFFYEALRQRVQF